jgi:hypothetical protein
LTVSRLDWFSSRAENFVVGSFACWISALTPVLAEKVVAERILGPPQSTATDKYVPPDKGPEFPLLNGLGFPGAHLFLFG